MDSGEAESLAVALYKRLRLDPSEPVSTFKLATRWLGPDTVIRPVTPMTSPAMTFVLHGERRIAIKRQVDARYAGFYVGHELGHILLDEIGYRENDVEQSADRIGAALVCPRPATVALYKCFGRDFEAIADELGCTETLVALRLAEVRGLTRAVVTPRRVYVRSDESFVWGSEADVRVLAKEKPQRPGISRAKLRDDPRRIVIDIDEAG